MFQKQNKNNNDVPKNEEFQKSINHSKSPFSKYLKKKIVLTWLGHPDAVRASGTKQSWSRTLP